LPVSHVAEKELLPAGWNHERLTWELICDKEMHEIWASMTPPLRGDDVKKLAVGRKKAPDPEMNFTTWEDLLAEIIVGDAFGVDRMDYLLRDSHHLGVAYGKFDHYRLIETLRILTRAPSRDSGEEKEQSTEPQLGVEPGGLQSAEALSLARYFMYTQVYFHPVRRIYDIHLRDFLKKFLPEGRFSIDLGEHMALTDNEVSAAIWHSATDRAAKGHEHARRMVGHKHFKVLFRPSPGDMQTNPEAGRKVFEAAAEKFGKENVRYDEYNQEGGSLEFPVRTEDGPSVSSISVSKVLNDLPPASADYVFVARELLQDAKRWLKKAKGEVITPSEE
jgi:HD superfamily phosphohydrolase